MLAASQLHVMPNMTIKNYLIAFISLLIGLSIGVFVGYRYGLTDFESISENLHQVSSDLEGFKQLENIAKLSEISHKIYLSNSKEEGKAAILNFINEWEKIHGHEGRALGKTAYYGDTGIAYARIAMIEESSNNIIAADKYWEIALSRLKSIGMDIQKDELRKIVTDIDSHK
jgi:hypothetical protein